MLTGTQMETLIGQCTHQVFGQITQVIIMTLYTTYVYALKSRDKCGCLQQTE